MFYPRPHPSEADPLAPSIPRQLLAWGRHHPWPFTILFTGTAFLTASVLPIWTAWYVGPWEKSADWTTFWEMLSSIPNVARQFNGEQLIVDFYGLELLKLAAIFTMAAGFGRLLAKVAPDV